MLFLVSIILLVFTTLFLGSHLRLRRAAEFPLAWGIISFAAVVLVFQVANLLQGLGSAWLVILLQLVLLAGSGSAWFFGGKPALIPAVTDFRQKLRKLSLRRDSPLIALLLIVLGVLLLSLVLIYVVPPNNNDALSFHVARIVRWKQQGSYFPWETPFIWQLTFPVNAQLTYLWTLLMSGTDHFIAYIPFLAGVLTSVLVYLFSREFRMQRSLFSNLILRQERKRKFLQ